tara:strand:+ start:787 stop:966 length:180 start_codon:yes stop_codon:yes gene_type:complete
MPSELGIKIQKVHPSLTNADLADVDIMKLQDNSDGKGAYIAEWNHPSLSKPTDQQLKDA